MELNEMNLTKLNRVVERLLTRLENEKKYSVNGIEFILYQDGAGKNGGSWRARAANGKGRDIGPFKQISGLKNYLQSMRPIDFE